LNNGRLHSRHICGMFNKLYFECGTVAFIMTAWIVITPEILRIPLP
jgi:hypothetical protein